MSEVIVVTSGKGGVGKTTTTANIGTGLAKLGKKVVMIDTDTGLRNLDVVLGLENRIVYNLVDVAIAVFGKLSCCGLSVLNGFLHHLWFHLLECHILVARPVIVTTVNNSNTLLEQFALSCHDASDELDVG